MYFISFNCENGCCTDSVAYELIHHDSYVELNFITDIEGFTLSAKHTLIDEIAVHHKIIKTLAV